MKIYEEKSISKFFAFLLLLFCFLLIYPIFQIGERELRWDEGYYAAIANEMDILKPTTVAQGEFILSYPLYPWLVAIIYKIPFSFLKFEIGLRLVSILSIAALCFIIWATVKDALDEEVAFVAVASFMSFALILEKGLDGYPQMLGYVFIFSAWALWFKYGAVKGNWNLAWALSFLFAGLAFYTVGWIAILFFGFPLIFMRRPLTIWSRIRKPGFFAGLGIIGIFVLIWIWPFIARQADMPFRELSLGVSEKSDYFKQIFAFPFELPLRMLPWSLLAWPAFCPAYQPLEKNQVFARFMRIIFFSLFFLLWFTPDLDWRNVTILAAPLAVLTSINYKLLVRRHGHLILYICRFLFKGALAIGISALFLHLLIFINQSLPFFHISDFFIGQIGIYNLKQVLTGITFQRINTYGIIEAVLIIIISCFMLTKNDKIFPVWSYVLILMTSYVICYWILIAPFQAYDQSSRELAKNIEAIIGKGSPERQVTIYKSPEIKGLNAPFLYLEFNVKKLRKSFDEIPRSEGKVYVIGPSFPASKDRTWKLLTSEALNYKKHELYLWEGILTNKEIEEEKKNEQ
ncbi:MAG: glycosyltransferase family 39 protein [Candidatus Nanoarchaeia archaeon]